MELLTVLLRVTAQLRSRIQAAMTLALCFALSPGWVDAAENELLEYDVKAAYLYRFGLFVEWPSAAFASPASPLNLCLVEEGPIGPILDATAGKQRVNEREVIVRRLRRWGAAKGIINFVIKDNCMRFDIDDEAAAQNGLGISSKLLSLAVNVKPRQARGSAK